MTVDELFEQVKEVCDFSHCEFLNGETLTTCIDTFAFRGLVKSGATKVVFVTPDCDKVIKIPFNSDDENYSEFQDEDYMYFECVQWGDSEWDYASQEETMYTKAKEEGVEEFFLKTEYYGEIDGWPVYIQDKASEVGIGCLNYKEAPPHELYEHANDIFQHYYLPESLNWCIMALVKYGEEKIKKLSNFLEAYNIGDLRPANLGKDKNGDVCIIDYSSYYE